MVCKSQDERVRQRCLKKNLTPVTVVDIGWIFEMTKLECTWEGRNEGWPITYTSRKLRNSDLNWAVQVCMKCATKGIRNTSEHARKNLERMSTSVHVQYKEFPLSIKELPPLQPSCYVRVKLEIKAKQELNMTKRGNDRRCIKELDL